MSIGSTPVLPRESTDDTGAGFAPQAGAGRTVSSKDEDSIRHGGECASRSARDRPFDPTDMPTAIRPPGFRSSTDRERHFGSSPDHGYIGGFLRRSSLSPRPI